MAFSLDLLELYHRLRWQHPRLGVQPFIRAICDLHDERCDKALRHNEVNWRIRNACPPCNLQLKNKEPMKPERLLALDGNNSAKRVASAGREDPRVFSSDYFLPRQVVDRYKDKVKRKAHSKKPLKQQADEDAEDLSEEEDAPWIVKDAPGDAPDGQENPTPCTERWKASAAEHEKRALNIYETTGIFVSACRHGAKYPLAILDHTLDVHGDNTGYGYNIGCSFAKTVKTSRLVGPKAANAKTEFVVCAFHSYAHNRLCQLSNHPLYRDGYGIEDLEVMERVFSASNNVARFIWYASPFHYMQGLDLHFKQWDEDKYAELSNFLLNNYRQCLRIVLEYTVEIGQLQIQLGINEGTFKEWLAQEKAFLSGLRNKPEGQVLEMAYVQALLNRQCAERKLEQVWHDWVVVSDHHEPDYNSDARRTRRVEASRCAAFDELTLAIQEVGDLETKLEIDQPWTPSDPRYQEALSRIQYQDFRRALDRVQQLVMQRLLELLKANMSGMAAKYFKILPAKSEIPRLNREVRHLDTSIELEWREYARALRETSSKDPLLAAELRLQFKLRRRVQHVHLARIATIRALPGYTGTVERGKPLYHGNDLFNQDRSSLTAAVGNAEALDIGEVMEEPVGTLLLDEDTMDDPLEDALCSTEL
ncbi:hypothetical protein GY45DRAFT_1341373, partial [Cubamyces sp. BRFM 1775]